MVLPHTLANNSMKWTGTQQKYDVQNNATGRGRSWKHMITAQHLQPRLWPPDKSSVAPAPKEILIKSYTSYFIALLHLSFSRMHVSCDFLLFTTPPSLLLSVHARILFKLFVFPVLLGTADEGLQVETFCIYC